jgi:3-oxo-5-alpha-steroid 4-dehydrogenase 1
MTEVTFFHYLILAWFALAGIIFVTLFFVVAPYGRHRGRGYGRTIGNRAGWIIMESTAPLVLAACFVIGPHRASAPELAFLLMWEAHYIHRAYIYPLQRRQGSEYIPLLVVGLGFIFNAVNGYINGRYLFDLSGGYPDKWLFDPRFVLGACLFLLGFIINRNSDLILSELRQPGDTGYKIARSGFYRWVSCPNYLGEIIIWSGWALATWSVAGLSFAIWTAANLIPRARSHHHWNQRHLPGYPPNRKALIPGIW